MRRNWNADEQTTKAEQEKRDGEADGEERGEVLERVGWRTDVRHRREVVLTATLDAKTYRVADGQRPVRLEDDDD